MAIDVVDKGATAPEGIVALERIMKGHKMAATEIRVGQPVRKFGQIIGFAKQDIPPGRLDPRAQHRHAGFRPRLCLRRGGEARGHPAARPAGHLPGLPPRQRQGRHPQLHRHPDLRELLGHRGRLHRRGGEALRHAEGLSQHRRHRGAEDGQWLRRRFPRRHLRHPQAHGLGLCHQSQHGRRAHGGPRLRGLPDPALQGSLQRHRERNLPDHDDPGNRRHPEDGGGGR